jgi:S1-C subfamily serine protease
VGIKGIKPGDVIMSVDGKMATTANIDGIFDIADDPAAVDLIRCVRVRAHVW